MHIVAASMFNVVGFGLFSSFALLASSTSRVVIVNYSMPIWASLMAWLILGERLSIRAGLGLVLCIGGLTVLSTPVATAPSACPEGHAPPTARRPRRCEARRVGR